MSYYNKKRSHRHVGKGNAMGMLENIFRDTQDTINNIAADCRAHACDRYTGAPHRNKVAPKPQPVKVKKEGMDTKSIIEIAKAVSPKAVFDAIYNSTLAAGAPANVAQSLGNAGGRIISDIQTGTVPAELTTLSDLSPESICSLRAMCNRYGVSDSDILDALQWGATISNADELLESIVSALVSAKAEPKRPFTMDFSNLVGV